MYVIQASRKMAAAAMTENIVTILRGIITSEQLLF